MVDLVSPSRARRNEIDADNGIVTIKHTMKKEAPAFVPFLLQGIQVAVM